MSLSFKECKVRSKLLIRQKNLIPSLELPISAYLGTIYLYSPEGSFITCYTYPTTETIYPESSHKFGGRIITNISFDIISRLHHSTFMFYVDWIKKKDKTFKLENQYEFDFQYHDDFLSFIKVAQKDGFQIYVRNT